jgi:hypothetical protein
MTSVYLGVEDVASRYGMSRRTVQALASAGRLPHRRLPATRRLLFLPAELARYEAGDVQLEVVNLPDNGRLVRLVASTPIDGA